jgi:hypothetical protein
MFPYTNMTLIRVSFSLPSYSQCNKCGASRVSAGLYQLKSDIVSLGSVTQTAVTNSLFTSLFRPSLILTSEDAMYTAECLCHLALGILHI